MTKQRATCIKKMFKKRSDEIKEKIELIPKSEKIRIAMLHAKIGKYECVICYDFKKGEFKNIKVIEETIEL